MERSVVDAPMRKRARNVWECMCRSIERTNNGGAADGGWDGNGVEGAANVTCTSPFISHRSKLRVPIEIIGR